MMDHEKDGMSTVIHAERRYKTGLFSLVGDSKDAVLVTFRTALYLTALHFDPKRSFDDPGEETGSTVADILSRIPERLGFNRVFERNDLFLSGFVPLAFHQAEPAHLGIEGECHIGERVWLGDAHFLVVFDVFLAHIHVGTVVHPARRNFTHGLF